MDDVRIQFRCMCKETAIVMCMPMASYHAANNRSSKISTE